jgi:hypothetical protein
MARSDGDLCAEIVHEACHLASVVLYGTLDYAHEKFGGNYYQGPIQEVCK